MCMNLQWPNTWKLKNKANTFAQHEICRRKSLLSIKNFNDAERQSDEPMSVGWLLSRAFGALWTTVASRRLILVTHTKVA